MGDIVQAAEEYVASYRFDKAVSYLMAEFNLTRDYAVDVCEKAEEELFAYHGT
jgi:hypothetical protein